MFCMFLAKLLSWNSFYSFLMCCFLCHSSMFFICIFIKIPLPFLDVKNELVMPLLQPLHTVDVDRWTAGIWARAVWESRTLCLQFYFAVYLIQKMLCCPKALIFESERLKYGTLNWTLWRQVCFTTDTFSSWSKNRN